MGEWRLTRTWWLFPVALLGLTVWTLLQPPGSRLLQEWVAAPSLRDNTIGVDVTQAVQVYLPSSYDHSRRRYPVLYFLPGYTQAGWMITGGAFEGFRLRAAMDRLTAAGRIGEMIVVMPNMVTPIGGTVAADSPVLGHWETYLTRDLVSWVDRHYRTRPDPGSRAIAGTTSGGSSALLLAMHHPDVFGAVYALDPVLLPPGALARSGFTTPSAARRLLDLQRDWARLSTRQADLARTLRFQAWLRSDANADHLRAFFLTMGMAFSPDPSRHGLPVRLPFRTTTAGPVVDPVALTAYTAGLGDWPGKISRYGSNLQQLRLIAIDYGVDTGIRLLPEGCAYVSNLLDRAGIDLLNRPHAGDPENRFAERLEKFLLPTVSRVMHTREQAGPATPSARPERGEHR